MVVYTSMPPISLGAVMRLRGPMWSGTKPADPDLRRIGTRRAPRPRRFAPEGWRPPTHQVGSAASCDEAVNPPCRGLAPPCDGAADHLCRRSAAPDQPPPLWGVVGLEGGFLWGNV